MTRVADLKSLRSSFNDVSRQPAYKFELENGLQGIAGKYKFPNGMRPSEFEDLYTWKFPTNGVKTVPGILAGEQWPPGFLEKAGIEELVEGKNFSAHIRSAWGELQKLNPELQGVRLDKSSNLEVYEAVYGVASCFNVNDINFYIEASRKGQLPGVLSSTDGESKKTREWIWDHGGVGVTGWAPSQPTLEKIKTQMEARGDKPLSGFSKILRRCGF